MGSRRWLSGSGLLWVVLLGATAVAGPWVGQSERGGEVTPELPEEGWMNGWHEEGPSGPPPRIVFPGVDGEDPGLELRIDGAE